MCFPEPLPTSATVPVEIVALDLVSCQPIQVGNSGDWDVQVSLSNPQPQGQMTATKLDPNGGVFSATLLVQPVYTFTRVGNPGDGHTNPGDRDGRAAHGHACNRNAGA